MSYFYISSLTTVFQGFIFLLILTLIPSSWNRILISAAKIRNVLNRQKISLNLKRDWENKVTFNNQCHWNRMLEEKSLKTINKSFVKQTWRLRLIWSWYNGKRLRVFLSGWSECAHFKPFVGMGLTITLVVSRWEGDNVFCCFLI